MQQLFTTKFDELFLQLDHYRKYPEMLPFIGKHWNDMPNKVLLIGESHYMPIDEAEAHTGHNLFEADWYNQSSEALPQYLRDYIHTRGVIEKSDFYATDWENYPFSKPLSIFYNIKAAAKEKLSPLKDQEHVFPYFSFYNYFQRPAFIEGDSISLTEKDQLFAYEIFKAIVSITQPNKVIFVSIKAAESFNFAKFHAKDQDLSKNLAIHSVPHPASAHWNMVSQKRNGLTGKEAFMSFIS